MRNWIVLIYLAIVWGGSFILMKKGLLAFSWDQIACLRIGISAIAFVPFLWTESVKNVDPKKIKILLIIGLTGNGLPFLLYPLAQTELDSSVSGVLNSLTPLFAILLSILFFKNKIQNRQVGGILLGFLGAMLLLIFGKEISLNGNIGYAGFVVLATMCYGLNVNLIKKYLQDVPPLTSSVISFGLQGPFFVAYLLFGTDFMTVMATDENAWFSLGSVSILALFGTVIATISFFYLIRWTNAIFASTVSYLIPIVAVAIAFLDGETIGFWHFMGMSLILSGVYLVGKK